MDRHAPVDRRAPVGRHVPVDRRALVGHHVPVDRRALVGHHVPVRLVRLREGLRRPLLVLVPA